MADTPSLLHHLHFHPPSIPTYIHVLSLQINHFSCSSPFSLPFLAKIKLDLLHFVLLNVAPRFSGEFSTFTGDGRRRRRWVYSFFWVFKPFLPFHLHFLHFFILLEPQLGQPREGRFRRVLGRRPAAVKLLLSLLNFVSLPTTCYVDLWIKFPLLNLGFCEKLGL